MSKDYQPPFRSWLDKTHSRNAQGRSFTETLSLRSVIVCADNEGATTVVFIVQYLGLQPSTMIPRTQAAPTPEDQNKQGPGGDLQAATRAEILGEEGDFPEQIKVHFRNLAGRMPRWVYKQIATKDRDKEAGTSINLGKYHGFEEYFKNTRVDPTAPVYTDRADQAKYQAADDPTPRKLIVYVGWPFEQSLAGMFFENLGLNTINLWPDTNPLDRAKSMRDIYMLNY
ncbi:hypothetical protein LTR99_004299 [Exophiala xenobiotica]|uniref:Uncharacterized protein n=1 Tax=Vermiconidia calcicola TaxID=1690605 RepID=A0AAV9QB11_9PEZI|nr:hypothetical protein LTR99_004299 [Exophiala xenobiotica]KAK5338456.1 hypothetical protein LTR98_004854 [Exophiala xenobiotica]KAK5432537.1 hypothetical protein LTR34_004008 [Exophiala xenobiotica]KAK5539581.1 hypothetical protein LTR25_003284 [Vermiconidia calcicola]